MNIKEYQSQASRTNAPMPEKYKHMAELHMLLGLQTEIGELTDIYKKNLAYGKEIDTVNEGEEVADILWYLVNFCTIRNIDIEEQLQKNINKLKVRFPDKFTVMDALTRDLVKEREILEN